MSQAVVSKESSSLSHEHDFSLDGFLAARALAHVYGGRRVARIIVARAPPVRHATVTAVVPAGRARVHDHVIDGSKLVFARAALSLDDFLAARALARIHVLQEYRLGPLLQDSIALL